jgi:hypothetical protein
MGEVVSLLLVDLRERSAASIWPSQSENSNAGGVVGVYRVSPPQGRAVELRSEVF